MIDHNNFLKVQQKTLYFLWALYMDTMSHKRQLLMHMKPVLLHMQQESMHNVSQSMQSL